VSFNITNTTTIVPIDANVTIPTGFGFEAPAYALDMVSFILFFACLFLIQRHAGTKDSDAMPAIFGIALLYILSFWSITDLVFAGFATLLLLANEFGRHR
jgi:hypothetical protein